MVRICTGEVWVRISRRSRERLALLAGETSVSWVSRAGWFGREVERLEVVEVGLDLWAERGGVAEMMEDGDDLVHRLQ